MSFWSKLEAAIARNQSLLVVGLDPNPEMMPSGYKSQQRSISENLRDWMQFTIAQTADLVCAYKPTLGFYEALGAPGIELLQQTLAAVPSHIPVILDAKHSDLNTSSVFARVVFEQWLLDAVTLNPYAGQDSIAPFLLYPGKAVFVLCCTSNPAAEKLQVYPNFESPLYLQVVKEARNWGTPEQVGLEVGTSKPQVLAKVRSLAPERLILVRSIWQENADGMEILQAGLNQNGEGLLIPVPQDWLSSQDPSQPIRNLREKINYIRTERDRRAASCEVWLPNVCTFEENSHLDLILQLYDLGCILFGDFVQASGARSPYYIDLRKIISNPQIFHKILNAYAEILKHLRFDRIAGIPYGSLPTATGLALRLNYPMIFPRKEVKAHGTRRIIEGNFQPGETIAIVDDVLISGKSALEAAAKIKPAGLHVRDIVVLIDCEKGVKNRLQDCGYQAHSVLTISEMAQTLHQTGRISAEQFQLLIASD